MRRRASPSRRWLLAVIVAVVAVTIWHGNRRIPGRATEALALHGTTTRAAPAGETIRIATFNIHGGKGGDGKVDLDRTAHVLGGLDIVALNEVDGDLFLRRNQAGVLADSLGMAWIFAPTERRWWHDHFGNALLTTIEPESFFRIPLPGTQHEGHRNAILARFRHAGHDLRVLATHLDRVIDREVQLEHVIELFLGLEEPVLLMGDLNTRPDDPRMRRLLSTPGVVDAGSAAEGEGPNTHVDWMLVRGLRPLAAGYERTEASDHPLLWADLAPVGRDEPRE